MTEVKRNRRHIAGAVGLLAAGAVTGGVLASTLSAAAASSPSPASTNSTAAPRHPGFCPGRGDEHNVSSSIASTLRSKALAAVPGGTVVRIETDAGDAAYEAHMKKAEGTFATVKFDKNYNVIRVENRMGLGDPHPAGDMGGPPPGGPSGSATG